MNKYLKVLNPCPEKCKSDVVYMKFDVPYNDTDVWKMCKCCKCGRLQLLEPDQIKWTEELIDIDINKVKITYRYVEPD